MIKTPEEMLDRIRQVATAIYARDLTLIPTFVGIRPDGSELHLDASDSGVAADFGARPDDPVFDGETTTPTPEAKNALNEYVRARFAAAGVQLYGVAMEVWVLESMDPKRDFGRRGISQEPERFEALWFNAEDRSKSICARQSIIRPRGRAPFLDDDFTILDGYDFGGRFCGLTRLPRPHPARLPGLPEPRARSAREALTKMDPALRNLLLSIAEVEAAKRGSK